MSFYMAKKNEARSRLSLQAWGVGGGMDVIDTGHATATMYHVSCYVLLCTIIIYYMCVSYQYYYSLDDMISNYLQPSIITYVICYQYCVPLPVYY